MAPNDDPKLRGEPKVAIPPLNSFMASKTKEYHNGTHKISDYGRGGHKGDS